MSEKLKGKSAAILATDGFEESELSEPKAALEREGATVHVIAPEKDRIRAWAGKDWGRDYDVDRQLEQARPDDYDASCREAYSTPMPCGRIRKLLLLRDTSSKTTSRSVLFAMALGY